MVHLYQDTLFSQLGLFWSLGHLPNPRQASSLPGTLLTVTALLGVLVSRCPSGRGVSPVLGGTFADWAEKTRSVRVSGEQQWCSHEFGNTGDQRFKGAPVVWGPSICDRIVRTLHFAYGRIFYDLIAVT